MNVVVRLPNWLGDTVMAVPALAAVRTAWPEARVLAAGPWASLLAGQALADVLVDYPRRWSRRLRAADTVATFGPDLAILLPSSLESALAAWYWGARQRVGFAGGGRSELLTEAVPVREPRAHQVDEYLVLVERCGAPAGARVPALAPPPADGDARGEARGLLGEAGAPAGTASRRVGVHLGAAFGPAKLWPLGRVTEFCRTLAEAGVTAVLLGAPSDAEAAATVAGGAPALSLVGRDRPALLPALLAELDVLVSGDTGVAHLAAALGTPVVTLFGPTDPRLTAPRGPATVLTNPVPCAPCFYRACPIEHPCLQGVEPARVWRAVEDAMAAHTVAAGEGSR
ncbi:MAG TPA: glycosyltransferase family 9 protein [Methylomirabilota bacterium]|nr:glycosyltransferase family 9 protein [Methylomirabilota bacterium]